MNSFLCNEFRFNIGNWLSWGAGTNVGLVFCRDSWVFFSCLQPIYRCRLRGGQQRKKARSVVHSGSLGNMKTNEELAVNKRKYYQSGQERAPVLIPHSRKESLSDTERRVVRKAGEHFFFLFFIKVIQLSDCSYNTNGLLVRLYTSDLPRFVLCPQQNCAVLTFEEEEGGGVCFRVGADPSTCRSGRFSLSFVSTSHYSRPFTL